MDHPVANEWMSAAQVKAWAEFVLSLPTVEELFGHLPSVEELFPDLPDVRDLLGTR